MRTQKKTEKKKVLIIDEDPSEITMLTMSLLRHGYKVLTASDGEEGVRLVLSEKPDLILLDNALISSGNGSLQEQLEKSNEASSIPLILMTDQSTSDEAEEKEDRINAVDYIVKPVGYKEAVSKIKEIIG